MELTDLAPATDKITVAGHNFVRRGITLREMIRLCARFPGFIEDLKNGLGPDAAAAYLAAHVGKIDDEDTEKLFDAEPAGRTLDLLTEATRRSFGPFDEKGAVAAASPAPREGQPSGFGSS